MNLEQIEVWQWLFIVAFGTIVDASHPFVKYFMVIGLVALFAIS